MEPGTDFGPNSTERYYNLLLKNLDDSYSLSDVPLEENSEHQSHETFRCDLNCNAKIGSAECFHSVRQCIDSSSTSFLTCRVKSRRKSALCDEFQRNPDFSIAFDFLNFIDEREQVSRQDSAIPDSSENPKNVLKRRKSSFCNVTSAVCRLRCEQEFTTCDNEQGPSEHNFYSSYQFWTFCFLALLGSMCHGAMFTLSDTACYEKLRDTKSDYGKQRFWGAVGWGLAAPLTGVFNDLGSQSSNKEDYSPGWYVMAFMAFFCVINLYFMDVPATKKSTNMRQDVLKVMTTRPFLMMELNILILGALNAYASNYVIWYMQILGSTKLQMGLALTVSCLFGEGPFLYISGWIISKLGHWHCVTLIFVGFAVRFGAYYLITDPWLILPVELLHGITFGLCYATMTSYGELISASGTEATIQGFLGGTYQGLGNGLGCLVAGISFDLYGGRQSFLLVAIFSIFMALTHYGFWLICKPQKKEAEKDNIEYEV